MSFVSERPRIHFCTQGFIKLFLVVLVNFLLDLILYFFIVKCCFSFDKSISFTLFYSSTFLVRSSRLNICYCLHLRPPLSYNTPFNTSWSFSCSLFLTYTLLVSLDFTIFTCFLMLSFIYNLSFIPYFLYYSV